MTRPELSTGLAQKKVPGAQGAKCQKGPRIYPACGGQSFNRSVAGAELDAEEPPVVERPRANEPPPVVGAPVDDDNENLAVDAFHKEEVHPTVVEEFTFLAVRLLRELRGKPRAEVGRRPNATRTSRFHFLAASITAEFEARKLFEFHPRFGQLRDGDYATFEVVVHVEAGARLPECIRVMPLAEFDGGVVAIRLQELRLLRYGIVDNRSRAEQHLAELTEGITPGRRFYIRRCPAIAFKCVVEFRRLTGGHDELVAHDMFPSSLHNATCFFERVAC